MEHPVKVLMSRFVTHNVKALITEKPEEYAFTPGQATNVAINLPSWKNEKRPFTFTSTNNDKTLELTIKMYEDGVTEQMHNLKAGDELLIDDPFGTISYQGPGIFIAGGAGITPFLAIFRDLTQQTGLKGNLLFFSNRTFVDIICERELIEMFGFDATFRLTREDKPGYENGRINKDFIKERIQDFSQKFYVCGPPQMVSDITQALKEFGASEDNLIYEKARY